MKKILLAIALLVSPLAMFSQGAKNIKINEVLTNNSFSLQDEFGEHLPWIELANTMHSTYNVRGMYITTDRRVLNESLSVPERVKMMSIIPNGDKRTTMTAREHLILFLNSNPAKGSLHLTTSVQAGQPLWIALYDGNGVDLIDSVSVPTLTENQSYARIKDGFTTWEVKTEDKVTPAISNDTETVESKTAKWKRNDPHGFVVTVLSMGIVFSCLALLYIVFRLLGIFMARKQTLKKVGNVQPIKAAVKTGEKLAEAGHKTTVILKDGMQTGGIDKEIYIAVISMALKQYQDDVHDVESGIITIRPHHTNWNHELQINEFNHE